MPSPSQIYTTRILYIAKPDDLLKLNLQWFTPVGHKLDLPEAEHTEETCTIVFKKQGSGQVWEDCIHIC